jgi:hypothetical protein
MNKVEIAEVLRKEVSELNASIKKVQARCDRLKQLVLDLEAEVAPPSRSLVDDGKFRKIIDSVFGEKPRRPKK